jgi:prephenate dehydratase
MGARWPPRPQLWLTSSLPSSLILLAPPAPQENATIGSVAETLEGFMVHADRVAVCAEVQLSVAQALIACPGAVPADIRIISSKPEAIAQCRRWLSTQYPHAQLVPAASTSAAVESIAKAYAEQGAGARHTAAIGSRLAAAMYDLPVMFPEVQDVTPNITRFFVLCSASTAAAVSVPSGDDKTAMLLVCYDRPGSLRNVLEAFARHDINLAHIDRRPCPLPTLARLISISGAGQGLTLPPVAAASPTAALTSGSGSASAGYLPALVGPHNNNAAAASTAGPAPSEAPAAAGGDAGKPPSPSAADGGSSSQLPAVAPSLLVPSLTGGRGSTAAGFGQAFFIEAVGHAGTPAMAAALAEVSAHCVCVKVLGSFPRARRVL